LTHWIRFKESGKTRFGTIDRDQITVYQGDMFDQPRSTEITLPLSAVTTLTPTVPGKFIGLWNNLLEQSTRLDFPKPANPWYFIKTPNTYMAAGGVIKRPIFYDGSIIFEAELGIVIGKECFGITEQQADDYIFGYTCVNDVTAIKLIKEDPFFEQWTRAKCFDGFAPMGPVIASGIDPDELIIRGILNGEEYQNYPVSDMIFSPRQLVSLISRDMTLMPGDLISCGTSLGSKSMREPSNEVEIAIDSVGSLKNRFE
jgi:2-keto-4-pentenoate hydratase/2-oxohepta-3-ene-1,7-dioic acid hydratase in catechol pathway